MRNVVMIRREPGLVSIPVESAVYCENCETVSTSSGRRCGLCGSEDISRLVPPIQDRGIRARLQPRSWPHRQLRVIRGDIGVYQNRPKT